MKLLQKIVLFIFVVGLGVVVSTFAQIGKTKPAQKPAPPAPPPERVVIKTSDQYEKCVSQWRSRGGGIAEKRYQPGGLPFTVKLEFGSLLEIQKLTYNTTTNAAKLSLNVAQIRDCGACSGIILPLRFSLESPAGANDLDSYILVVQEVPFDSSYRTKVYGESWLMLAWPSSLMLGNVVEEGKEGEAFKTASFFKFFLARAVLSRSSEGRITIKERDKSFEPIFLDEAILLADAQTKKIEWGQLTVNEKLDSFQRSKQ